MEEEVQEELLVEIYGEIANCGNKINVTASDCSVGGIAGRSIGGKVDGCFNVGSIVGNGVSGESHVGGIVGSAVRGTQILDCYNKGSTNASNRYTGGIVGAIGLDESMEFEIMRCFNVGTITGSMWVGSLVGCGPTCVSFTNCFYTGENWFGYFKRKLVER